MGWRWTWLVVGTIVEGGVCWVRWMELLTLDGSLLRMLAAVVAWVKSMMSVMRIGRGWWRYMDRWCFGWIVRL